MRDNYVNMRLFLCQHTHIHVDMQQIHVNIRDTYVYMRDNYVVMLHADKKKSNADINKSHVNIVMWHVHIIYLACRNIKQKYATIYMYMTFQNLLFPI